MLRFPALLRQPVRGWSYTEEKDASGWGSVRGGGESNRIRGIERESRWVAFANGDPAIGFEAGNKTKGSHRGSHCNNEQLLPLTRKGVAPVDGMYAIPSPTDEQLHI